MKTIILTLFLLFAFSAMAESRIKIAVIDTGIGALQAHQDYSCDGHKSYIDNSIVADMNHGKNIISILSKDINPKTHCIVSYKVYKNKTSTGVEAMNATLKALKHIVKDYSIRYVNISMGGPEYHEIERKLIKRLLLRGVTIVVAAGNERDNLDKFCNYFPACYKNTLKYSKFYVVKSALDSSNYGSIVTDKFSGYRVGTPRLSGTSQAAAQKMAKILKSVVYTSRGKKNGPQKIHASTRRAKSNR